MIGCCVICGIGVSVCGCETIAILPVNLVAHLCDDIKIGSGKKEVASNIFRSL